MVGFLFEAYRCSRFSGERAACNAGVAYDVTPTKSHVEVVGDPGTRNCTKLGDWFRAPGWARGRA